MKRIFIAIDISEEARQMTASYIDSLRRAFPMLRVGWERPEKLHLTLKFLGDVNDATLEKVRQAAMDIASAAGPFRLSLTGTGRFPPKGDPKTLWIGVEDDGQLSAVAARLEDSLHRIGLKAEKRRFTPHLTIGRLREPERSRELAQCHLDSSFGPAAFDVRQITIYESRLQPKGSIYTQLVSLPLGANT
ncbi:MAG: RNA 2',3'-cyclic phosphodiesterase [Acidobacteria bacterium]|nr:RNA 2',3'-cyclic phosphodiesterase [Acidobacteriota bacterium]